MSDIPEKDQIVVLELAMRSLQRGIDIALDQLAVGDVKRATVTLRAMLPPQYQNSFQAKARIGNNP